MPNPYDQWLDEMFGPVGGDTQLPQGWTPPAPTRRRRRYEEPEEPQEPEMNDWQRYGGMAARGIGGLLGFTPWTGALGGGAGEIAGQMIEQGTLRPDINPYKVAGEAAAGAAGGGFAKLLGMGMAPLRAGITGAAIGGASPILRHGIGEGDWDPRNYAGEVALAGGLSGATGAGAAWLTGGRGFGKPTETPGTSYQVETTAVPGGRGYQGGHLRTNRGTTTLEGATTGVNQPVKPIPGSGVTPGLKQPLPLDPDVESTVPYVGMPSMTQKQQRMVEVAEKEAAKAAEEAARLRQIENEMAEAGLSEADRTVSFGRSTSAKDAQGRTMRMSERFAKEVEEGGSTGDTLATGPTGPDVVPVGTDPADELSELRAQIEATKAQMAELGGDVLPSTERRAGFMDMFRANPPMRSQAVGVPDAPPMADVEFGGAAPNLRRQGLQRMLGEYPPAPSQAVGVPEAPPAGPFTPEIPPSPVAPEPQAPSGLAKVLGAGKRGKRASKSKVTKFDEGVQKILGGVDEGVPGDPGVAPGSLIGPGGFEVPSAVGPVSVVDDLIPTPPAPHTPPPQNLRTQILEDLEEELASPTPNLGAVGELEEDFDIARRLQPDMRAPGIPETTPVAGSGYGSDIPTLRNSVSVLEREFHQLAEAMDTGAPAVLGGVEYSPREIEQMFDRTVNMLSDARAALAKATPETPSSPATLYRGNRGDVSKSHYEALQALLKANPQKLERELHDHLTSGLSQTAPLAQGTRLAGAALRREGGKAGARAPKAASSLEEMLNASVAARTAPEVAPAAAQAAPEVAQAAPAAVQAAPEAPALGNWIAEEEALLSKLSGLPKEQRLQALLDSDLLDTPPAPVALAAESAAEPDWVAKAMAEVEELGAKQASQPKAEPVKTLEGLLNPKAAPAPATELDQVSELQKLLLASKAIKEPGEIANWMKRLRLGENVMPEGPPPVVEAPPAPKAAPAGRGRLRTSGTREDAPLPQDYSPTPGGKRGPIGNATSVPPGVNVDAPAGKFIVKAGEGKAVVSQEFETFEEANEFVKAARETGKFKNLRLEKAKTPTADLKPRLNKNPKKGGEAGFGDVRMLSSLLGAGLGAATGGAMNDEDPIAGALGGAALGAGAGFALPTIASKLTEIGASPEIVGNTIEKLQHDGNTHEAAAKIAKTLPQFVRFNYLMDGVGLPANFAVGPWGSGVAGTLEAWMSGDPRGKAAFLELVSSPMQFLRDVRASYPEAMERVGRAEGYALSEASGKMEKTLAFPGSLMTAGDIAIRNFLQRHGFSDDEARIITMTSEPFTKSGTWLTHGRGLLADLTLPFKRTPVNIAEQGFLRMPGIGSILQGVGQASGRRAADPIKTQLLQQGMGLGVGVGSEQLGENVDPTTAKWLRRYLTNAAGPYGLLAGLGFTAGQAKAKGVPSVPKEVIRTLPYNLPMPSLEPITDALTYALEPENLDKLPRGAYPAAAVEQFGELYDLLNPPPSPFAPRRRR